MRVLEGNVVAEGIKIGIVAVSYTHLDVYKRQVQGEGLYGFDGIRRTAELMMEAYREEKDTEKLVIQKGWGCECCL